MHNRVLPPSRFPCFSLRKSLVGRWAGQQPVDPRERPESWLAREDVREEEDDVDEEEDDDVEEEEEEEGVWPDDDGGGGGGAVTVVGAGADDDGGGGEQGKCWWEGGSCRPLREEEDDGDPASSHGWSRISSSLMRHCGLMHRQRRIRSCTSAKGGRSKKKNK